MVRVQRTIEAFPRTRLGKEEIVSEHTRTYDVKPELSKGTREKIVKGKAKRIKAFNKKPLQIQMDLYSKPTKDAYTKEFNKTMREIINLTNIEQLSQEELGLLKRLNKTDVELSRKMGGWRVKKEERIKPDPDVIKYKEIQASEIYPRELKLKGSTFIEKERNPIKRLKLKNEIAYYQNEVLELKDKVRNKPYFKKYQKKRAEDLQKLEEVRKNTEKFSNFIEEVNEEFENIEEEEDFAQFNIDTDFRLVIQKKETHSTKIKGKRVYFPLKNYEFEDLNPNLKIKVMKIIKNEFMKEYSSGLK